MKRFLYFIWILILTNSVCAAEKLIFAIDVIRHGDRTPIHEIPKQPYHWKEGLGELTAQGMHQEFELGASLRKKYIDEEHLLPAQYNAATLYVRSTDINRTLMSAESFLLGLYPLGTGPSLSTEVPALPFAFQPIPIHTTPISKDRLLDTKPAKNPFTLLKLYFSIKKSWKKTIAPLQNQINSWSESTGLNLNNPVVFDSLADTLNVRKMHHIPYPKGISSDDADKIITLGQNAALTYFRYKEIYRPMGHRLLTTMSNYFNDTINNKSNLRYVLFSGHDTTLLTLMSTLGVPLDKMPHYASRLNVSLYDDNGKYYVKVYYNDQPVSIPSCGGYSCTLSQFSNLAEQ